ncbi:ATP-dependent helicase HrpB [Harenicola maris]|uniref:ATP-dependent helicase HrpB n=1 Tax=Harenicola maris TaxID=2841044 RepID=UPI002E1796F3
MAPAPALPIDPVLPDVITALRNEGQVVLQAPPGAGKTTRVPLALAEAGLTTGKILMLEPRRIAARAAAERLAEHWGEAPGGKVGYRMRGDNKPGTVIEVVTEGILTRMIQSDPELSGVGAVIFDEFHERSLQADLGLALTLEVRRALREDLLLVVMSATLDAAPVAALMDNAPMVTAEGRSFPVDVKWLDRPARREARLEALVADLAAQAAKETGGNLLAFLPGEGEIRRTAAALTLPGDMAVHPLYGALPFAEQRAAIAPPKQGRKIVLATSIAETSLTIEGISAVIDGGMARRAAFDPGTGLSRLITTRASRAEITQRAGRAGRLGPGTCYRAWAKAEEGGFPAFAPPEIAAADLTGLALELAAWGADTLPFLTPPPEGALAEARSLLRSLGALDAAGSLTAHGRALARLPLHPRLGHMLLLGGPGAADIAALLGERDPLRGASSDLTARLRGLRDPNTAQGPARAAFRRMASEAKRLRRMSAPRTEGEDAEALALAFPDRIGLRRPGDAPRFLLSGGRGAEMAAGDPLAGQRLIVAAELDGAGRDSRIRLALPLSESALRGLFADQIAWHNIAEWSRREGRVIARRREMFGALTLSDQQWSDAPDEALAAAALEGLRQIGLPLSAAAKRLLARVALYRAGGGTAPDVSETALMESAEDWLLPYLSGLRSAEDLRGLNLLEPLRVYIGWDVMQALDSAVPSHFTTPLGRRVPIDYAGEGPEVSLRLQEVFGLSRHPTVGGAPLRLVLLSPGHKPVQVTQDLPGFWATSYADVRKDMRGRYPKHPWPEDPANAAPTERAKPRK